MPCPKEQTTWARHLWTFCKKLVLSDVQEIISHILEQHIADLSPTAYDYQEAHATLNTSEQCPDYAITSGLL